MMKRSMNWIAFDSARQEYLSHPRGEWTTDVEKAYGWYYKTDCQREVCHLPHTIDIGRRKDFRTQEKK